MVNGIIGLIIIWSIVILGLLIYSLFGNNANQFIRIYRFFKNLEKFRHIFSISSILFGVFLFTVLLAYNKSILTYLIAYYYIIQTTYWLICIISKIIYEEQADKFTFYCFLIKYGLIIVTYIVVFAWLYYTAFILRDGYFIMNGKFHILTFKQSITFSAFTLFSHDIGLHPVGLMSTFVFIQIFISQLVIFGFLFAILGDLMLRGTKYKNSRNKGG